MHYDIFIRITLLRHHHDRDIILFLGSVCSRIGGSAHVAGELHVRPKRSMLGDRRFALHSDSSDLTSSFGAAITSTTSDHSRHIDISRRRLRNKIFIEQCRRLVSEKHNPTYRIMSNLRDRWWQEACNCFLVDNFNDGTAGIGKSAILLLLFKSLLRIHVVHACPPKTHGRWLFSRSIDNLNLCRKISSVMSAV